jgi:hypothetical protein
MMAATRAMEAKVRVWRMMSSPLRGKRSLVLAG